MSELPRKYSSFAIDTAPDLDGYVLVQPPTVGAELVRVPLDALAARSGRVTLVSGVAVVNTALVAANTNIQLTVQSLGTVTTPKTVAVTARTANTSFTITSSDLTDTSIVAWSLMP